MKQSGENNFQNQTRNKEVVVTLIRYNMLNADDSYQSDKSWENSLE